MGATEQASAVPSIRLISVSGKVEDATVRIDLESSEADPTWVLRVNVMNLSAEPPMHERGSYKISQEALDDALTIDGVAGVRHVSGSMAALLPGTCTTDAGRAFALRNRLAIRTLMETVLVPVRMPREQPVAAGG